MNSALSANDECLLSVLLDCDEIQEVNSRDTNPMLESLSIPPPPLLDLDNDAIKKATPKVE